MIDKKKIEEAAIAFGQKKSDEYSWQLAHAESFKAGVNWFKESLWHPMSEKPETGSVILLQRDMEVWRKHHPGININNVCVRELDYHDHWASYADGDEYKCWLDIDDLLKGGGHE